MPKSVCDKAFEAWDKGNHKTAFDLMLSAAESGDVGAFFNLGYFYDVGIGTRKDRNLALHWYKSALRAGESFACRNIALVYLEENNKRAAKYWFEKGISLGELEPCLDLAKLAISGKGRGYKEKALKYLRMLLSADDEKVYPISKEEAEQMLLDLERDV